MQGAAAQRGNGVSDAAEYIVERQEGPAAKLDDDGLLGGGGNGAPGLFGAHGRVAVAKLGKLKRRKAVQFAAERSTADLKIYLRTGNDVEMQARVFYVPRVASEPLDCA